MNDLLPSSREGIERYLASGLIEGIGPVYAKKLVERFGEEIFDVIEKNSARLEEVPGVGSKRRREIRASWDKQKSVRAIMVFLHQHGISTGKAVKIYQAYGETAIDRVRANPWQLAEDIHGIGFKSADSIAQKLGIAADAPDRLKAGLFHLLLAAGDEGHCALPRSELITRAVALLNAPPGPLEEMLVRMLENTDLVREVIDGTELIFPPHLARAEKEVADRLRYLSGQPSRYPAIDAEKALAWVQQETGRELAEGSRVGADVSFELAGGPHSVTLRLAISHVSIENARGNLYAEHGRDFEGIVAAAQQAWEDRLTRVRIKGASETQRRIFYTALYRAFQMPSAFDGSA